MSIEKSTLPTGFNPPEQPNFLSDSNRYKSDKGEISLLEPCYVTMNMFEIYCIDGDLFDDIERYDTLEEAEQRINELLK